jgi:hypothetical protein
VSQLPVLVVPRIGQRVPIDGDLNKSPWCELASIALAASHGRDPGNAATSVQATALRVCHDGARLYVSFECADRDVWGSYRGRNERIYDEEVVEAFLAPGRDPRRYFELESSPRSAYWEGIIDNPDGQRATMRTDLDWVCAGWERAVRVCGDLDARGGRDEGWSVEWAIPFAALGAPPPRSGERWRANFHRIERAHGAAPEFSAWAPTHADPAEFHLPAHFGVLEFA